MNTTELVGKTFNFLTVVEFAGQNTRKNNLWKCQCVCGNFRTVPASWLKQSSAKSCGCKNFTLPHGNRKTTAQNTSFNSLLNRHLQTAKRKNREWNLTKDEFKNLIFSNCHYCNTKPSQTYNVFVTKEGRYRKGIKEWADSGQIFYNGIDRKDNEVGYTKINSLPCCFVCNRAKLTMSYNEFLNWVRRLKENYENLHS